MKRRNYFKRALTLLLACLIIAAAPAETMVDAHAASKAKNLKVDTKTYTPETFPYSNSSKAKSLIKTYQKALKNTDKFEYVTTEKASNGGMKFKQTLNKSNYVYYGDIKSGRPNGEGVIFYSGRVYFIGNFKNGVPSGYGIEFASDHVEAEGNYKNGLLDGDGVEYSLIPGYQRDDSYYTELSSNISDGRSGNSFYVTDFDLVPVCITFDGKWSKGDYSNGKLYTYSNKDKEMILLYDGGFSKGKYSGDGTLYFSNGKVKYEGKFSRGTYNGKGTLYNSDGSVQYKGKFKDGNIA